MKKYLFFISILFISCQDEITLDLPQAENKLVVEGTIENGFPPYIIITKNQGYFDDISIDTYSNLFINDIDSVKIWYYSDGVKVEKELKSLEGIGGIGLDSLPPIYTDLSYFNNTDNYEFSKEGRTYFLEIKWNNQTITSETTIPTPTPLDCLWVKQSETAEKDFKCDIRAVYSDPANQQNNILIKSKRLQHFEQNNEDTTSCLVENNKDPILKLVDAGSDILINGQSFETYFPRPSDNGFPTGRYNAYHTKVCDEDTIEFKKDIVLIKFCQIDEPSMKFWRGLVRQAGTNGNPFSEPSNLPSNINGALGVFTGYGAVYYKVPIIKDTIIYDAHTTDEGLNILDIF